MKKKIYFTVVTLFFCTLGLTSWSLNAQQSIEDPTVTCKCTDNNKCAANGDNGSQCNSTDECWKWSRNCSN